MSKDDLAGLPKWLDLDRLAEECKPYGADPIKVLAYALSEEARLDAKENGMTLKAQSDLAFKVVDKANASQTAVKHSGDKLNPVSVVFSKADEDL
jgi:hypothetical protein